MISTILVCLLFATACRSSDSVIEAEKILCYDCSSAEDAECVIDSQFIEQMKTVECDGLCYNSTATTATMTVEVRGCVSGLKSCDLVEGCHHEDMSTFCYSCCATDLCNNADTISPIKTAMLLTIVMNFINRP